MEIVFTILIVLVATFIIYKNIKKSSKGDCNCGTCSSHCPKYNSETNIKIESSKNKKAQK